jgi:cell division protease FtsH
MPPSKTWLWFLGVLLANYLLMRFFVPSPDAPVTVPYTLFKEEVGKGNVFTRLGITLRAYFGFKFCY